MADDELNFEFEAQLSNSQQKVLTSASTALDQNGGLVEVPPQESIGQQPGNYKRNYKKTVCTYWLRGMCMKGDQCGFLHQYDVEKMPICRNLLKFGECKELDCPYKHNTEEIKECNMYKLGFCIYGPTCRYKHKPAPGPPPKIETVEAAKPKDYRDVNMVVNFANPGVINAKEHEALVSLGMGASLRRQGGQSMGGGRRRFGHQQQNQVLMQLQPYEDQGPPSHADFGQQQPYKRARLAPDVGGSQDQQQALPSNLAAGDHQQQQQQQDAKTEQQQPQQQGLYGAQGGVDLGMGHMPGIMGGLVMPPLLTQHHHQQQHHQELAMPSVMGQHQYQQPQQQHQQQGQDLASLMSGPMHPAFLLQLQMMGLPGFQ